MTMDYITLAGFALAIFVAGVTTGKFAEKIERFINRHESEEHRDRKNDRR